jgi:hypothetical protein
MLLSSRRVPVRWAARVALALSLAWLLAPSEARAGCGDGLLPGGLHGAMTPKAPTPAEAPKAPCHGPHCSAKPPSIPFTPPAPPVQHHDGWASGTPAPPLPDFGSGRLAAEGAGRQPARRPADVFHPPRTSLS